MQPIDPTHREVFTVTQLNRRARQLLETHLPLLWVEGELSNFVRPSSGHWYFTLKDENAQVRCAMFRGRNQQVRFQPANGNHVLLRCRVSLYEERGDYQLIAEHMEEAGDGLLQRRFEALKAKLQQEGLFDNRHKQPLPTLPKRIGVITSPTGAALHDILTVLARRFPAIPVTVYPSQVQGEAAARQLRDAIAWANRDDRCDVLIVGRGGGSLEDLWPFNEELVARAIFDSPIPIVSAVGHEVDFTIADFVADYRAPTPSAAAELLSPDGEKLAVAFANIGAQLLRQLQRLLRGKAERLLSLRQRLRHPRDRLRENSQRLDHLEIRLRQTMSNYLERSGNRLAGLETRLAHRHPTTHLKALRERTQELQRRLLAAAKLNLEDKRRNWREASQLLQAVSPLHTLERGYAIVLDSRQRALKSIRQVKPGDKVSARLSDGTMHCEVLDATPGNQSP